MRSTRKGSQHFGQPRNEANSRMPSSRRVSLNLTALRAPCALAGMHHLGKWHEALPLLARISTRAHLVVVKSAPGCIRLSPGVKRLWIDQAMRKGATNRLRQCYAAAIE
jgi:hypothetical protein